MARYGSDSDDDRRSRHRYSKSSRKRDGRSRSRSRDRDRRRRSRSREDERRTRRRSRSRSSERGGERSYKSSARSSSSKKGSRSGSRNTSDSEMRKDGRDKREKSSSSGASSQVSKEKTKEKMKNALKAVESKDEELKLEKEKKERAKLVPDAETILQIESNEFSAQSFSSSVGSKNKATDKSEIPCSDQSHETAMFGGRIAPGSTALPLNTQSSSKALTTDKAVDKENLLASCLHEDEDSKNARWIEKLKKLRQQFLAAT